MSDAERLRAAGRDNYLWPLVERSEVEEGSTLILTEGEGVHVTTVEGERYLDLMSTVSRASSLGYSQERIARAVYEQLGRLHYGGCGASQADVTSSWPPGWRSWHRATCPRSRSPAAAPRRTRWPSSSRVSTTRRRGIKPRAYKVIARATEYHGAAGGAMAASDWLGVRRPFEPGIPGFSRVPAPTSYRSPFPVEGEALGQLCADLLEREILEQGPELVSAFILEPVMQANGVQIPPPGYMKRVREICRRHDVVFIADEVITGFGRTGEWFAVDHWDIRPDVMTMAKGITGGFIPLGATMVTPRSPRRSTTSPTSTPIAGTPPRRRRR